MKKILSLVVVLVAIGQLSAKGIEPKSPAGISVIKRGSVVKLFYRGEQSGKVKITIYSEKGRVVFKETLQNTDQFMRPYNFSLLPEGEYTIELKDQQGQRLQKVIHTLANGPRVAHLTRLNEGENKYILFVPNKGRDTILVKIYDARNNVLYEGTESVEGNFAKIYNLNEIDGQHIFEVVDKSGRAKRLTKPVR